MYYELRHHGVKGMRWGVRRVVKAVGKARNTSLRKRATRYAQISSQQADQAKYKALSGTNGSRALETSDRYLKKAQRVAKRMRDKGQSILNSKDYKKAIGSNRAAAKNYIERSKGERAASVIASSALSVGGMVVASLAACPIAAVYVTAGPKYKLSKGAR